MLKNSGRMHDLAGYLGELNKKGEVKGADHRFLGKGEERGYAFIARIGQGCAIFLVHMVNDDLVIYLKLTSNAEMNHQTICNKAIADFKEFFPGKVTSGIWTHPADDRYRGKKYSYDATGLDTDQILLTIDKLKEKFA